MSAPDTAASARRSRKSMLLLVVSFIAVCLIWGTTWIGVKLAITDMPPLIASGLRFVVAAPVFVLICRSMRQPLWYPPKHAWFFVFILLGYFAIPFFLFNYGEQFISSGLTAICFSSVAVMMVVFSVPMLRTRITTTQFVAVVVAFTALGALVVHSQGVAVDSIWGIAAVLTAAAMHALTYIMIKRYGTQIHSVTLNTMPMALAGVLLTGLGLIIERPGAEAFTARSIGATIYLGVVASVIGFIVYFWLVQRMDTVTVSFVFVLFPIVSQVFSVWIEKTSFDLVDLGLTVLILGAFAITQWGQRRTAKAPPPALDDRDHPSADALAEIYRHATATYPAEACGFIRADGVTRCANMVDELTRDRPEDFDRSTLTGYAFGVADLRALSDSIDGHNPVRVIYHSHPDVGSYFSDEDHRNAVFERMPVYPVRHLVVDATATRARGARLFDFSAADGRYVEVAVFGEPYGRSAAPVAAPAVGSGAGGEQ